MAAAPTEDSLSALAVAPAPVGDDEMPQNIHDEHLQLAIALSKSLMVRRLDRPGAPRRRRAPLCSRPRRRRARRRRARECSLAKGVPVRAG